MLQTTADLKSVFTLANFFFKIAKATILPQKQNCWVILMWLLFRLATQVTETE